MIPGDDHQTALRAMNPGTNQVRAEHSLKDRRNQAGEKAWQDVVLMDLHRVDRQVGDLAPERRAQDNRRVEADQEPAVAPEVGSSKSPMK